MCDITGGEISTDYLDIHEKEYADKPEWIDISKINKIKFHNSVNSVEVIKEAVMVRDLLIK